MSLEERLGGTYFFTGRTKPYERMGQIVQVESQNPHGLWMGRWVPISILTPEERELCEAAITTQYLRR